MKPSEVLEQNRQAIRNATERFNGLQDALEQMMLGTSAHLLTPGDFPETVLVRVLSEAKPI